MLFWVACIEVTCHWQKRIVPRGMAQIASGWTRPCILIAPARLANSTKDF